jgi:hypothetical protein
VFKDIRTAQAYLHAFNKEGTSMRPARAEATPKYFILVLCCLIAPLVTGAWAAEPIDKPYHHLLILGDPHLPGKYMQAKENVIRKINSWDDVDMVIAVGDICEDRGTDEEYAAVKIFFEKLNKPLRLRRHDVIYSND